MFPTSLLRILVICLGLAMITMARSPILPHVSIGVSAGDESTTGGTLKGLEPLLIWTAEKEVGDASFDGGLLVKVEDLESFPYSVWGRLKRSFGGWDLSARVESNSNDLTSWDVDLKAVGDFSTLQLKGGVNTASPAASVSELKVTQELTGLGGLWAVTPRYNVPARRADVRVVYGLDDISISVDANADRQKVTVSRLLGSDVVVSPSISTKGDVELEYRHNLATGSLAAQYKPNDSLTLMWEDGPWQAILRAPIKGAYQLKDGIKVNIRRDVDLV